MLDEESGPAKGMEFHLANSYSLLDEHSCYNQNISSFPQRLNYSDGGSVIQSRS